MSDLPNDAVLRIVRFCWPGFDPDLQPVSDGTHIIATFAPESWTADDFSCYGVRDAERILIERGHAEAYGREVFEALNSRSRYGGLSLCDADYEPRFDVLAQFITLSLDARVRAMAAVIEKLEGTEA